MFFDCKGRLAWLVCGLIFLTGCGNKTLFINEISLMESKLIRDESGKNDDWLELYNSSSRPRDLAGMYLTDNRKKLTKWKFPGKDPEVTTIPGKGFLIVWMDKDIDEGPLHTNFRLDNGGDMLWLVDKDGSSILDSVAVAHMPERDRKSVV